MKIDLDKCTISSEDGSHKSFVAREVLCEVNFMAAALAWLNKNRCSVSWNDRIGGFIVQREHQVVGHIGSGRTYQDAVADAMGRLTRKIVAH